MLRPKLGLIGIIGEEAKRDFWGTMKRVAEIGYEGVEAPDFLLEGDSAHKVKRFAELGLQVATHSANREELARDLDRKIREAQVLGTSHLTVWWASCATRDDVLRDAQLYQSAGTRLSAEGIKLCYHNHDHELRAWPGGESALDLLAEHTDPASLYFRLDVAWITLGGAIPAAVLRKLKGRVPAIHLKDVYGTDAEGQWTAVGTGIVDIAASIRTACDMGGLEWMTVEQDQLRNLSPFETVQASYLNLKEAGWLE